MNEVIQGKSIQNILNGTVIDHIPAGEAMKCLKLMKLKAMSVVLVGMNLNSKKMGLKDFVKIEDYYPSEETLSIISLVAPNATISKVKEGVVVEKKKVRTPEFIENNFKCINPKCVTNTEKHVTSKFKIESVKPLILRCVYCDKQMTEEDLIENE